ncbi:MCE family protein [Rhodococcoides kroppenstedtii]|uniref:MCE family protein n=1 Tax=Rhodococcoides kroppenstedtii TaxID=293050 RepID=UPI0028E7444E|nr:MCE family protein [Rhodococcus kroppenstedtii]
MIVERRLPVRAVGVAVLLIVAAVVSYTVVPLATTTRITVEFARTTGLYPGDDVKLMGVTVGSVDEIRPRGDRVEVDLSVDDHYRVPADAKAVLVSPSLVTARFVQLAPAWIEGEALSTGDRIPLERTAIPVEWDRITEQLDRVSRALAPDGGTDSRPLGALVDAAEATLDGRGETVAATVRSLSDALRTLSDGRTDLYAVVRNLQVFASALAASDRQIVQVNDTLASVSTALTDDGDEVGAALVSLDAAVADVTRFARSSTTALTGTATELQSVVAELAAQRDGIAQILHVAPTALSNLNNIYQPAHNAIVSSLAPNNFATPADFVCSAIAAAEQVGAQEGSELCLRYLGPLLRTLAFEYLPVQSNPIHGVGALPGQIVQSGADPVPPALGRLLVPGGPR